MNPLMRSLLVSTLTFTIVFVQIEVESVNITVISLTTEDDHRDGFLLANPVYDVILHRIKQSNPVLFENFTHIALRYISSETNQQSDQDSWSIARDDAGNFFFRFFFQNERLFLGSLSEQFTIITTPAYGSVSQDMALFARDTNALLALASPASELSNIRQYPTTINIFGMPDENFIYCFAKMMQKFGWTGVNQVCGLTGDYRFLQGYCNSNLALLIQQLVPNLSHNLKLYSLNAEVFQDSEINNVLTQISNTRVNLLILIPPLLRRFLITAHKRNMTNGDYVFVTFSQQGVANIDGFYWKTGDPDDEIARIAFRALLLIYKGTSDKWNGTELLIQEIATEYTNRYNWSLSVKDMDVLKVIGIYEWMLVFTETFRRVREQLGSMTIRNFVKECTNKSYDFPSGKGYFDQFGGIISRPNPIRRLNFAGEFQTYMTCDLSTNEIAFTEKADSWFGIDSLPRELPVCGLHGEKCLSDTDEGLITGLIPASVVVIGITLVILVQMNRHKVFELHLAHLILDQTEISFGNCKDQEELQHELLGCPAIYKDYKIFEKIIQTGPVSGLSGKKMTAHTPFTEALITLSHLRHPYLAEFYGIVWTQNSYRAIYERPEKGTLQNILVETEIFNDIELRFILTANLIEGLHFIHSSDLKYHGALSSQTCLLNNRYTMRIVQAGFTHLVRMADYRKTPTFCKIQSKEVEKTKSIVDEKSNDVKNLGIILAELFGKTAPTGDVFMQRNSKGKAISAVFEMMEGCQNIDNSLRPSTNKLLEWAKSTGFLKRNIVELILYRLQKQAETLEDEVALRTTELVEERKKVDDLLNEMLPRSIISKLRHKEVIVPEMYENVTLLFSDIPVFSRLIAECEPMEVVTFLSQIHSQFDRTVAEFDAYKVETINDSYVVASGLPVRNGTKHAAAVCHLALSLRVAISNITVQSWGNLAVCPRIGIHSGSIAAGVVGTQMPRYCLFGDTMNTASRMESHGNANKIHVSGTTRQMISEFSRQDETNLTFISRGSISIKGKGLMETFWLQSTARDTAGH